MGAVAVAETGKQHLSVVPSLRLPEEKRIGYYGSDEIFSKLGVTPISQTTIYKSLPELERIPPTLLLVGVDLEKADISLHEEVQKVLQICAKKGIDVLFIKQGEYPRFPGVDRIHVGGERNIGQNETPRAMEVITKLRERLISGSFTLDQILGYNDQEGKA